MVKIKCIEEADYTRNYVVNLEDGRVVLIQFVYIINEDSEMPIVGKLSDHGDEVTQEEAITIANLVVDGVNDLLACECHKSIN
jgi:hypothetical protein